MTNSFKLSILALALLHAASMSAVAAVPAADSLSLSGVDAAGVPSVRAMSEAPDLTLGHMEKWVVDGSHGPLHIGTLTAESGVIDLTKIPLPEPDVPAKDQDGKDILIVGADRPADLIIDNLDVGKDDYVVVKMTLDNHVDGRAHKVQIRDSSSGNIVFKIQTTDPDAKGVPQSSRLVVQGSNADGDGVKSREPFKAEVWLYEEVVLDSYPLRLLHKVEGDNDYFCIGPGNDFQPIFVLENRDDSIDPIVQTVDKPAIVINPSQLVVVRGSDRAREGAVGVVTAHHLLAASDMDTIRQRLGEARRVSAAPGKTTPWVRVQGSRWKASSKALAPGFKLDEGVLEMGLDHQFDSTLVGGFLDYVHADSKMDGDTKVKSRGGRAGLYLTHNLDCGAWIDVVGRIGFDRNRLRYKKAGGGTAEVNGIEGVYGNLSVETGRSFEVVDSLRVEPQFQVVFTRSGKVTITDEDGLRTEAKAHSDVTTRLGALVEKSLTDPAGSDIRAYGKLSWERNWSKAPDIRFSDGRVVKPDWKGNRFVYGLGIEGTTEKKHTWHASVEQSRGGAFRNDVRVDLGMRFNF